MNYNRYKKPFFKSLFWHQNKWHRHGVLVHTLKVMYHVAKAGRFDLLAAAMLHDIAKPLTAYHDAEDIKEGSKDYSFTNHEELSYYLIKDWKWITKKTKDVVRYHYHIRGMAKAKEKGKVGKYNRYKREFIKLHPRLKYDLAFFMKCDDKGKK